MTTFPVTVPASLVSSLALDPAADDRGQAVRHAVGTTNGETYVLSGLWREAPRGAGDAARGRGRRAGPGVKWTWKRGCLPSHVLIPAVL